MIFPAGAYSALIVGDQWVFDQDLMALSQGKVNRSKIKLAYSHFEEMLRNVQSGPLADQEVYTGDDLRNVFHQGEKQARQVVQKYAIKEMAYSNAHNSIVSLQHDLTSVANEGNNRIKEIQDSKIPIDAKVTQIVAAVK